MQYRSEIDGLRAIAVSSVVLFHAGFPIFRGGYIGVDIFFVISGFLITVISIEKYRSSEFSILSFFERRARRIIPALVLMCATTAVFSLLILNPLQLIRFFESFVSTFLFSSNFYFMFQSGYFDTASELKPLLHTWSLAVEEQYYIIFPFVFLLLLRLPKKTSVLIVVSMLVASLISAQLLLEMQLKTEAFYLLPTRIWQLLVGVLCAILVGSKLLKEVPNVVRQPVAWIGLLLVCVAIFVFNNNTPSPGLHALIPTVGAGLVLVFADFSTSCGRFLKWKPFVFIGLISYSAYLWHQPVFALFRVWHGEEPAEWMMGALCILVVILSYLSWKFVETTWRNRNFLSPATYAFVCISTIAAFVVFGVAGFNSHGYLRLLYSSEQSTRYEIVLDAIDYDYLEHMYDNGDCQFWSPDISETMIQKYSECSKRYGKALVVLGDSHGMNVYNIIAKTNYFPFVVGVVQAGCRPHGDKNNSCQYSNFLKFLRKYNDSIGKVIYHQSGSHLLEDMNSSHSEGFDFDTGEIDTVIDYLEDLSQAGGDQIVWLGPFIEYKQSPMEAATTESALVVNAKSPMLIKAFDEYIGAEILPEKLNYFPFSSLYDVPPTAINNNCFIFRDGDHFSRCGEDLAAQEIRTKGSLVDLIE